MTTVDSLGPWEPARLNLARLETPVRQLNRIQESFGLTGSLYAKRDDLTGLGLSGNKIRKLEYLIADAVSNGFDTLITCGGIQSNHCRATAIAAAQSGLKCTVVLRGEDPGSSGLGNLLLNRLCGARVRWITPAEYRHERQEIMEHEAEICLRQGGKAYIIPEGGSNSLGSIGYVRCVKEIQDWQTEHGIEFDVIATAVGSGGTLAGLAAGAQFYGLSAKVVGFAVCDDTKTFTDIAKSILKDLEIVLPGSLDADFTVIDKYKGIGYAQSTPEEEAFLQQVARREGLILDPAYTCKAFLGLTRELHRGAFGPDPKVLFIHTGGAFGTLAREWDIIV